MVGPWSEVFSPVFVIRFLCALVGTAIVAWGISFLIADYVVKANVDTINERISALDDRTTHVDQTAQGQVRDARSDLTQQLQALVDRLDVTNKNLDTLTGAIGGLTATVDNVSEQVKMSASRQAAFEQLVLPYLLSQSPPTIDPSFIKSAWGVELTPEQVSHLSAGPDKFDLLLKSLELAPQ